MSEVQTESAERGEVENTMSPEARMVVACSCLAGSRGEMDKAIRPLIGQGLDWDLVVSVAGRNGVLPLLANTLTRHFGEDIPEKVCVALNQFLRKHTRDNLYLTSQLMKIVGLLDKEEIPNLPFKGPSLAIQAFGNPVLRHFVDLDILVRPRDFDQAFDALCRNGYLSNGRAGRIRRAAQLFTQRKDVVLTSPDRSVYIELHWKLSGSHFALPVQISQFWEKLEHRKIGNIDILAMPFEDLFAYLCVHAARHEWERLGWIVDLLEVIEAEERQKGLIEWPAALKHAADLGCERIVRLGLFLLLRLYGKQTLQHLTRDELELRKFESIVDQVTTRLFAKEPNQSTKEQKKQYLLTLQESGSKRAALYLVYLVSYFRIMIFPNARDLALVRLPPLLYPLYFVLRPLRLSFEYLKGHPVKRKAAAE